MRVLLATVSLSALMLSACGDRVATAALPWTTAVDSTGDTTRVRITGDVPDSLVRTPVVDLAVGQADGAEELTFGRIGGIVVGNDGAMFVYDADQTVGLIRMYAATGKYLRTVGAKGGGPGEYGQLNGFTVARNGDLLIWDGTGARVNRYAVDGRFTSAFRIPVSGMFTANGLHVATTGIIALKHSSRPPRDRERSSGPHSWIHALRFALAHCVIRSRIRSGRALSRPRCVWRALTAP